jgi:hypothetical protein
VQVRAGAPLSAVQAVPRSQPAAALHAWPLLATAAHLAEAGSQKRPEAQGSGRAALGAPHEPPMDTPMHTLVPTSPSPLPLLLQMPLAHSAL